MISIFNSYIQKIIWNNTEYVNLIILTQNENKNETVILLMIQISYEKETLPLFSRFLNNLNCICKVTDENTPKLNKIISSYISFCGNDRQLYQKPRNCFLSITLNQQ